jgi:hypothetical protein
MKTRLAMARFRLDICARIAVACVGLQLAALAACGTTTGGSPQSTLDAAASDGSASQPAAEASSDGVVPGDDSDAIAQGVDGDDGRPGTEGPLDGASDAGPLDANGPADGSGSGRDSSGDAAVVCGDGVCAPQETSQTCPRDCVLVCGDVTVDVSHGLMWQVGALATYVSWDAGGPYCRGLNVDGGASGGLHGYTDWRLPGYEDVETLLANCKMPFGSINLECSSCADSPACAALWPNNTGCGYWDSYEYGTCCAGGIDLCGNQIFWTQYKVGGGGALVRCDRALAYCVEDAGVCRASEQCVRGVCVPRGCTPPPAPADGG